MPYTMIVWQLYFHLPVQSVIQPVPMTTYAVNLILVDGEYLVFFVICKSNPHDIYWNNM